MKKFFRLPVLAVFALALAGGAFLTDSAADAGRCPNGPDYNYVSRDSDECLTITFFCEPGTEPFFIEGCGCGCKTL